ncbi:DUF927 domain-containing protein [Salmonella enterica]
MDGLNHVVRGGAAEWRDNVASLMRGNHSMILGVLVGLSAPLNSLAGGGCFGIHLFAQSSSGKTVSTDVKMGLPQLGWRNIDETF